MKYFLPGILLLFINCTLFGQAYKTGHRTETYTDALRNNRSIKTEVYYPADTNGEAVPLSADGRRFPLLVFGHGYQLTYQSYLWLKDSLVPKGYFVAFPRTEEVLFPDHTSFAKDIAFLVTQFNNERTSNTSWLYNRVLNRYAVSGHSMGGGCALLAVQYNNLITAVAPLAASETNPSAIAASSGIQIPALIFAGSADCVTPPSTNQLPMYQNIGGNCKTYININKARHCHWAANNGTCTLGELFCAGLATNPQTTLRTTFSFMLPWLNAALYRSRNEFTRFNTLLTATQNITYQQSCNIAAAKETIASLSIYPVPVHSNEDMIINLSFDYDTKTHLFIAGQSGERINNFRIKSSYGKTLRLTLGNVQKGIYFITIAQQDKHYKGNFVVH